jgi:uncharacterized protein
VTRLFFATDLHGSETCWRKFLNAAAFYRADVLICGGDMTGKAIVPMVEANGGYEFTLGGTRHTVSGGAEADAAETRIQRRGYYPVRMSAAEVRRLQENPARVGSLFTDQMCRTVERWLRLADEKLGGTDVRCFVCPGNDDEVAIDDVIRSSSRVQLAEGRVIELDGHEMISTGWSNPTPWNTHREEPEDALGRRVDAMASQLHEPEHAIFNLHVPPYGSKLDEAPALDDQLRPMHGGRAFRPVGSTAVREAIARYQPLLSLHGHIHESKGASRLGRTLAINPGSSYEESVLMAAIVELDHKKGVRSYQLVNG